MASEIPVHGWLPPCSQACSVAKHESRGYTMGQLYSSYHSRDREERWMEYVLKNRPPITHFIQLDYAT